MSYKLILENEGNKSNTIGELLSVSHAEQIVSGVMTIEEVKKTKTEYKYLKRARIC